MINAKNLIEKGFISKAYPKNSIIYEPEFVPKAVYFIEKGEVRMVTVNKQGKEFIQGIFKAGECFGEPALLVNRPYLAFTITNKDSFIITVNKNEYFDILRNNPEYSMSLIKVLSNRLFYKSIMLEELANEKAAHRLITIINYLFKDSVSGECLNFTRQELADMTGLRVETVIREIKSLSKSKLIILQKGKIIKP